MHLEGEVLYRSLQLLGTYPKILRELPYGYERITEVALRELGKDYLSNPVSLAKCRDFDIFLNQADSLISAFIGRFGYYEIGTTRIFERILKPGQTVVDVGANIGWFTLLAASLVGPKGKVYAFEPEPLSFSLLEKSIRRNSYGQVLTSQVAVSARLGLATLHLSPNDNMGLQSTSRDFGAGAMPVQSVSLDEALPDSKIDLLKADVEGGEPAVFDGAKGLLRKGLVENIVFEWNPQSWGDHFGLLTSLAQIFDFFQLSNVHPFGCRRVEADRLPSSRINLYLKRRSKE